MIKIQNELKQEVIDRSTPATITFAIMGIFVLFSDQFPMAAKYCAIPSVILNFWRLWYFSIRKNSLSKPIAEIWPTFYWPSMFNGFLWGIIFFASAHFSTHPWMMVMVLVLNIGYIAASIFTVGPVQSLHAIFVISVSMPTMISLLMRYLNGEDSFFLSASLMMLVACIYAISQARVQRIRFIQKIKADRDLIESQKELLEQRSMTEHANRLTSIGELAAGFAHEINNPLAIITGNLQLIETQLGKKIPPDAQIEKLLTRSIAASTRISKIIKGLRTLSRKSSNEGLSVHLAYSVIQETLGMFEERFFTSNIDFQLEGDDLVEIKCDNIQISQIVLNLLNNACDVLQEEADKNSRWIKIKISQHDDIVVFDFINGGKPISQENLKKLFTPFFTTKPVGQGMGLGLSISKSIANQHNGDLNAMILDGHTCFRLTLPIHHSVE